MTLYLIGLGLWNEKDISLKGLETAKNCEILFMEEYTSKLGVEKKKIEELIGKEIKLLSREEVEQSNTIIKEAENKKVGFLVGGDPTVATTHVDVILQAKKENIKTKVIHSSSIYTSVCESGLFIYKFGKSCSIPFPEKGFEPKSFYETIKENLERGLHTLIFLDLKPEQNKFMTIKVALEKILDISKGEITSETIAIGFARLGSDDQIIKAGKIRDLLEFDFGKPQHTLIIPGELHFMEKEALNLP